MSSKRGIYKDGFIKNYDLLQENSNVDDLLDLGEYVNRYFAKINGYSNLSMIALKGRFGIGKSTFLYQLEKKIEDIKTSKWFEFDAWKYPNRDNLWESFVLELARSIDEKEFEKIIRKIEGKTPTKWVEKFVNATSGFISSIKNFNDFLNTSPAKRTFEIQNILIDIINSLKEEEIFIIIEDIDRSGDNGIYFLETLNNFIKKSDIDKRIKIIVPISNESYNEKKYSYHKCFDYIDEYEQPEYKLNKFIETIFIDDIKKDSQNGEKIPLLLVELLEGIFSDFNEQITIRELKLILRNANEKYKLLINSEYKLIDYIIVLVIEISKIIIFNNNTINFKGSYFEYWKKHKNIDEQSKILFKILCNLNTNIAYREPSIKYEMTGNGIIKKFLDTSPYDSIKIQTINLGVIAVYDGKYPIIGDLYFRY